MSRVTLVSSQSKNMHATLSGNSMKSLSVSGSVSMGCCDGLVTCLWSNLPLIVGDRHQHSVTLNRNNQEKKIDAWIIFCVKFFSEHSSSSADLFLHTVTLSSTITHSLNWRASKMFIHLDSKGQRSFMGWTSLGSQHLVWLKPSSASLTFLLVFDNWTPDGCWQLLCLSFTTLCFSQSALTHFFDC